MINEIVKSVKSFLAEKQAVATKERQIVEDLNKVLSEMGYHVVPAGAEMESTAREETVTARQGRGRQAKTATKSLACPRCSRRFAHPLHLGRHMSATHGRKKKAA